MARAEPFGRAGARRVAECGGMLLGGLLQLLAQGGDALRGARFEQVEPLAQFALELGSHGAELLQKGVQLALLAQYADAELFDLRGGIRAEFLDASEKFVDFVGHILLVFPFSLHLNPRAARHI